MALLLVEFQEATAPAQDRNLRRRGQLETRSSHDHIGTLLAIDRGAWRHGGRSRTPVVRTCRGPESAFRRHSNLYHARGGRRTERLWNAGVTTPAAILLAGAVTIVAAGYVAGSRHDIDGTTEVAAVMVLATGVLAGLDLFDSPAGLLRS